MADEVYQANVYMPESFPWYSFKKVLRDMGDAYNDVQLVSFHSTSKGMIGECGRRGGYFELVGIEDEIKAEIYKMASVSLCPNVQGQLMVDLMVHPPQQGDASFDLFQKETLSIYGIFWVMN